MIHIHIVADHCGLADHHAHAVIDDDAAAELRRRMDLDSREQAPDIGHQACAEKSPSPPECIPKAVPQDGVDTRIAEQNLGPRSRRRVSNPVCFNQFAQKHEGHASIPL
jgi:hypothetical protein